MARRNVLDDRKACEAVTAAADAGCPGGGSYCSGGPAREGLERRVKVGAGKKLVVRGSVDVGSALLIAKGKGRKGTSIGWRGNG